MLRVTQERTLAGILFQMVGAAVRKPRVPNDKLHHVTDNRLAEADRKILHGVCQWRRLAGYILRITGIKSFKDEHDNFKLDASIDGQPVKFLQNGGTRISMSFACNNACEGILSALEMSNMFSRNPIQIRICSTPSHPALFLVDSLTRILK